MKVAVLFYLFVVSFQSVAEIKIPLPPVKTVQSKGRSVDDAYDRMLVSGEFAIPARLKGRLISNVDPVQYWVDEITALTKDVESKTVKLTDAGVSLTMYSLGDRRLTEALIKAFQQGIRVQLITDLNTDMEGEFTSATDKFHSDFTKARYKTNANGSLTDGAVAIRDLVNAGMKYGVDFFSQPFYNAKFKVGQEFIRIPILHEKVLQLKRGLNLFLSKGTANASPRKRYNRIMETSDPDINQAYGEHFDALRENYKAGLETSDLRKNVHTRVVYQDQSYVDIAFTDGRFNPNQRMVDTITNNAKTVTKFFMAMFADTMRPELEALRSMLDVNSKAEITALGDDKFAQLNEWGIFAAFTGLDVVPPLGKFIRGFSRAVINRIHAYIYLRPLTDDATGEDVEETEGDLAGAPDKRYLIHDKTKLIKYLLGQTEYAEISTGSENDSNNVVNADNQDHIRTLGTSWLADAVEVSIQQIIDNEPQWATPADFGITRDLLAKLFERSPLNLANEDTQALVTAALKRDLPGLEKVLQKIAGQDPRAGQADVQANVQTTLGFFDWYFKQLQPSGDLTEFRVRRLMCVLLLVTKAVRNDYYTVHLLRQIIWREGISVDELTAKIIEAGKKLNVTVDEKFIPQDISDSPSMSDAATLTRDAASATEQAPGSLPRETPPTKFQEALRAVKTPAVRQASPPDLKFFQRTREAMAASGCHI